MKIKLGRESVYCLGLALFLVGQLLGHTLLPVPPYIRYSFIFLGLLISIFSFVILDFNELYYAVNRLTIIKIRILIFIILLTVISIVSFKRNHDYALLVNIIFILSAYHIHFEKILKTFFVVATSILIIMLVAYILGLIGDGQVLQGRKTFGYRMPTDLAQLIVYITLSKIYLNLIKGRDNSLLFLIILGIGTLTLMQSNARLGSFTLFLLVPYTVLLKRKVYKSNFEISKLAQAILKNFFFIGVLISYIVTELFIKNPNNWVLQSINRISSARLINNRMGIEFFGYSIWGQNIYTNISSFFKDWFYIDNSFYVFLLSYGLALLVLVGIGYRYVVNKCLKIHEYIIPFILLVIVLDSLIDQHFYSLEYNIFLLLPFSLVSINEKNEDNKTRLNDKHT
ncbi:hypothetical protein [Lactobacillus helveticus]|uniref:hypothetical protein n=1 Tax=Lactobacillus helveticus TaxID=1587 RepID=UPI0021A516A2|nr:hypothetical protein [Lactobacillus helveticus]MCT3411524.1 hypothetical protein [Lactobacillus helveticus]MCT3415409.1 hypothetical protein [Lactobacillus helveticus]MCT3427155.1 hypothetical protein [Lactobacillus helveticus]